MEHPAELVCTFAEGYDLDEITPANGTKRVYVTVMLGGGDDE